MAEQIAEELGYKQLTASVWIRERLNENEFIGLSKQEKIDLVTKKSMALLRSEPLIAARFLSRKLEQMPNVVLDGIRNPQDFEALFRPGKDFVIFLEREGFVPYTEFERIGIHAIKSWIDFQKLLYPEIDGMVFSGKWESFDEFAELKKIFIKGMKNARNARRH